ncbi:MAG: histidine phosphatase family protein [Alphaproteobacteria bacterium]|nr:histidine phosphatase family protein [Alphaproteobacteria bacterium]
MKIYIIRHTESEDDVLNCWGGCADFELTKKGVDTARAGSEKLVSLGIKKIFSSPYKRAKNVANIISENIGANVKLVDDLKEINTYGVMCGVNKDLAKKIFSLILENPEYKSYGYYSGKSFYGGEDVGEFDRRVKKAFDLIVAAGEEVCAAVTHGGVFRSIYKNILNKPEKILEIDDMAVMEIDYDGKGFNLVSADGIKTE